MDSPCAAVSMAGRNAILSHQIHARLVRKLSDEWAYTLEKFSAITGRHRWLLRYRVSYFQQYINLKTFNRIAYNFLLNIYLFFLHSISIFRGSFFQRSFLIRRGDIVFFLSQNITYLQHVVPVIKKYHEEGKNYIILCPGAELKPVRKFLVQSNAHAERLICVETVGKKRSDLIIRWLLFPLLFAVDYFQLSRLGLKNILLIPADFAKFSLVRHICEKRMDRWIPEIGMLITATDHWMWESMLHEKAKALGIPNFIIQHGLFGDVFYPILGSHICVWGEYYRNILIDEMGAAENEVIVTGSGYFDELYNAYSKKKTEKKYLTFMSQPFGKTPLRLGPGLYEQTVEWLNSLIPLAEKHNLELLVKLHPRDREQFYPQLKGFSFTKKSLPDILSQSRLAITVSSTSILESSLLDVPVIQLYNPSFSTFYDLSTSGLSILASSRQQLYELMEKLLSDEASYRQAVENIRRGREQHFFRLGNSLEYFDRLILERYPALRRKIYPPAQV